MTPRELRQLILFGLSIAFLVAAMFGLRWSHEYWWLWAVASILCGLGVMRPEKEDPDDIR